MQEGDKNLWSFWVSDSELLKYGPVGGLDGGEQRSGDVPELL
jgi:hypothetical protein